MRLGVQQSIEAPQFAGSAVAWDSAASWAGSLRRRSCSAVVWPLTVDASDESVAEGLAAAGASDLVIAEVRGFRTPNMVNPISRDIEERRDAVRYCKGQLTLADRLGARCCVVFSGSLVASDKRGIDPGNLGAEAHERLVEFAREVIDAVQPQRTFLTVEGSARVLPDCPEAYLDLIRDVDRRQFGVHLDVTNWVSSPRRYFDIAAYARHCIESLAPHIRSYHLKDVLLERDRFPICIREVPLGEGALDLGAFILDVARLTPDAPVILEHLRSEEEYDRSIAAFRAAAAAVGVALA